MKLTAEQTNLLRGAKREGVLLQPFPCNRRTAESLYTRGLLARGAQWREYIITPEGIAALESIDAKEKASAERASAVPLTNAERQQRFRAKQAAELTRLRAAAGE